MGEITKLKTAAKSAAVKAKADEAKAKAEALGWYAKFRGYLNDAVFVQLGHGAGGYGIVLTSLLFSQTWLHLLYGWVAVAAWTFPKEYVFDIYVEKQTYADGWVDQRSYLIGALLASVIAAFVIR